MFDLRPRTRAQLLDRWNRHTKLCPICQKVISPFNAPHVKGLDLHMVALLSPCLGPKTSSATAAACWARYARGACSSRAARTAHPLVASCSRPHSPATQRQAVPMQALKRVDLARQACVLAAGAALALAVLRQGQALPALGLAAAAVGCRALLGQLRLGFFTASKPPGSQWHEAPPPPAVEWLE